MEPGRTIVRPPADTGGHAPGAPGGAAGGAGGTGSLEGDEATPDEPAPPRRARRLLAGAGILATGAVVAAVVSSGGSEDPTPSPVATATVPAEIRTLTQTDRVDGILDFGESHGVTAGGAGTLTSVVEKGSTLDRGDTLFAIDQHPTVLLTGAIPFYRDLAGGVGDGQDVAQLEMNLAALGHTGGGALVVDGHFDGATTAAVEAWQEARDVEVTGRVTPGDAAFLPGPVRVAEARLDPGATVQPGVTVLDYTGSTRVVRAQLEPSQADLAHVGDSVTVRLPDGSEVGGTVAAVATTTAASGGSEGSGSGGGTGDGGSGSEGSGSAGGDTTAIDVTITLADQGPAEAYTAASVAVELTGRQREDVLAVPVSALVALAGSGYALEVVRADGATELVLVEPGMFADGYVEVSGDGIAEGTEVVVPER